MLRSGKWRVGWLGFEGDPIGPHIKVLARHSNDNIIMVMVDLTANIPSLKAGYAIGCILINSQSGAIYSNEGSATSCSFVATSVGGGGTAGVTGATGHTGQTGQTGTTGTTGPTYPQYWGPTGASAQPVGSINLTIGATAYDLLYK